MPDGVLDDVRDCCVVLVSIPDHLRPVAAAEDVVLTPVALVEGAGVGAVQVPHPLVEVCLIVRWALTVKNQ